ncbi:hypothetical protein [Streptomyces sp. MMG1121]|uniref:hypothetical protein n=1 Tax=Streptomyces sp. MMG1121 TaxID=1415544 RepID=UPI000AB4F31D|nr:hypothetical protein [Streptomyces sp. MMG1121]
MTCRKFGPAARNYAVARLAADLGQLINEARMLDLDDVRWELGQFGKLNVRHGKGSRRRGPKPRLVPLINIADRNLRWFIEDVWGHFDGYHTRPGALLFPSERKNRDGSLKASCTNHYRRGLIKLLDVLEFRSSNHTHRPVIEALALVARYAAAGNTTDYPLGETVPVHKAMAGDWAEVVHRTDKRGRRRVVRMVYEVVAFQALRDQLKCKEIWVVGAVKWRNLDEDLPQDFAERREGNYRELRKPLDAADFVDELREQMTTELTLLNDGMPRLSWPDVAERKSGAIRLRPSPSRRTCAGSRARRSAGGASCRSSTCSKKPIARGTEL